MRFRPRVADRPKPTAEKPAATAGKKPAAASAVYVAGVDPYQPTKKIIRTGLQGEEYTEVISGIKAGDKVLVRTKSLKPKKETDESADENDDAAN